MDQPKVKIYTSQRMTGRYQDEMRKEAEMLVRTLDNYGFEALNPVVEEKVPAIHEILPVGDEATLRRYWARDKEMIREADILLDYGTQNVSDGTTNELGYARWCLWKPTVRVWTGPGGAISRLEHDLIVPNLTDALEAIKERWGDYGKLKAWREAMWNRSYDKWLDGQIALNRKYGVQTMRIKVVI